MLSLISLNVEMWQGPGGANRPALPEAWNFLQIMFQSTWKMEALLECTFANILGDCWAGLLEAPGACCRPTKVKISENTVPPFSFLSDGILGKVSLPPLLPCKDLGSKSH